MRLVPGKHGIAAVSLCLVAGCAGPHEPSDGPVAPSRGALGALSADGGRLDGAAPGLGLVSAESATGSSALASGIDPDIPPPQIPHVKPLTAMTCAALRGANIIRVKFREGSRIRLNTQTNSFYSNGGALTPQELVDLAAINAIPQLQKITSFETPVATLEALHVQIEQATGYDEPDLTLWFRVLAGTVVVDPVSNSPSTCATTANLVNQLNSYGLVEIAIPIDGDVPPPEFPFLPLATDIPPTTTGTFEPPHMAAFPGLNSPLPSTAFVGGTALLAFYSGSGVGIADIEYDFGTHEKFNASEISGGTRWNRGGTAQGHAIAAMGAAFGTVGLPRYGTRGFAPDARRAFSPQMDTEWFTRVRDVAEALERAGSAASEGDIVWAEVQIGDSQAPVDQNEDNWDVVRSYSLAGRIYVLAAGNGGLRLLDGTILPDSLSIHVAANSGTSPMTRLLFTNFGPATELSAWGQSVWSSEDGSGGGGGGPNVYPGAAGPWEKYIATFAGTSSASALAAGALGQVEAMHEGAYSRRMGLTASRNRNALLATIRESGTDLRTLQIGYQPNVLRAINEFVLAARLDGCVWDELHAPHDQVVAPFSFASTTRPLVGWSSSGCSLRSSSDSASRVTITESSVAAGLGPLDLGSAPQPNFSIMARVRVDGANGYWQTVIGKEYPRNYGIWITPNYLPEAGRLAFSYWPQGATDFCTVYSTSRVDNGLVRRVALVFERDAGGVPSIRFSIDGALDRTVSGCTANPPANDGSGGNTAYIGTNLRNGSEVADLRLYHRLLTPAEVSAY